MIPPLAPNFEAALRDVRAQQPGFRKAAAHRLADPPPERMGEAVRGLLLLSGDADGGVRAAALESLGSLEAQESKTVVRRALDDPHPGVRQAAVLALGRIDPAGAAIEVAPLLGDPRPDLRFAALWTLSRLGPQHARAIARGVSDSDAEVRALSAECLSELDAFEYVDAIAGLLQDEEEEVRFRAAASLATLGDDRGASALRVALQQPGRAFAAAVALGDLRDEGSHAALERLGRHPFRSAILRAAAARGLVLLGDPKGVEILRKLVRSWRIEARQYAVQLVGELGLVSLVPDLAHALGRSSSQERFVYRTALERLAPRSSEAEALLATLRAADHPA